MKASESCRPIKKGSRSIVEELEARERNLLVWPEVASTTASLADFRVSTSRVRCVTAFFSTNKYGSVGVRLFRSLQELANDLSTFLQKLAVFQLEGIQSIAVDVNFSDDTSPCSDWRYDFRLSAQRA
jgi:hypothetical protein